MDDAHWDAAIRELTDAAERLEILARCVGVGIELGQWRAGDAIGGMSAADGLDQARGELERLVGGDAQKLLDLVERVAGELPLPME